MDIKDPSPFRLWVQRIWMENREEHLTFNETPFTIKEYWNQHKYWLKRKYQQQREKMISEIKLQKLYEQYFEFTDHMVSQYDPSAVAAIMLTQALSIYRTTMTEDDYNQMIDSISAKRDKVQIFQSINLQ